MNRLYPHRTWLIISAVALALLFGSAPLLRNVQDQAAKHLLTVKAAHTAAEQSIHQLDDDVATVQKLNGQIGAEEAERVLAPANRLQIATILEHQAAQQRLSHLTYSLSPEQPQTIETPIGAQQLALSTLDVEADAPTDASAYTFIDHLRASLPGRLRVQHIALQRIGKNDAPVTAANVHMTATLEWLSNGAAKSAAGGL